MAMKHPDHEHTFCECFGPCDLCEEYRRKHGEKTELPKGELITEGPLRGFTRFKELTIPRTKDGLLSYHDDIRVILEANSVKEQPMTKNRLRAFLLNKKTKTFIGPVEAEQARGFDADVIVFERMPMHPDPQDHADYLVFKECTLGSLEREPLIAVPMQHVT